MNEVETRAEHRGLYGTGHGKHGNTSGWAPTTQSWQLVLRRTAPRKFLIKQQLFENFE